MPALAHARCASACMSAHVCVCACACVCVYVCMLNLAGQCGGDWERSYEYLNATAVRFSNLHHARLRQPGLVQNCTGTGHVCPMLGCVCAGQHDVLVRGRACLWHRAVLVARHFDRNRKCRCAHPCDIFLPARTTASALARSRVRILTDARQYSPLHTNYRSHSHSAALTPSHARNARTLHTLGDSPTHSGPPLCRYSRPRRSLGQSSMPPTSASRCGRSAWRS